MSVSGNKVGNTSIILLFSGILKQVAKILPIFKKNPNLYVLYLISDIAIAKPPFLYPSVLSAHAAVPGCTILLSASQLPENGILLRVFFLLGGALSRCFLALHLTLPPSYGKWSTAAPEKSWCKCKTYSKGINTQINISEVFFSLPRHLYLDTFLDFVSLLKEVWIFIISGDLC